MNIDARGRLHMALSLVDADLVHEPFDCAQLSVRADLLAALGESDLARAGYLAVLQTEPGHFAALGSLATLQFETGHLNAAQTLFAELAARYPAHTSGHAGLGRVALLKGLAEAARGHFKRCLALDPCCAPAHQGLSAVLLEDGDIVGSAHHRRLGFGRHPITTLPFRGSAEPVRLLLLVSNMGGDLPWPGLIDDRVFQITAVNAAFCDPERGLPAHDLVFNAIGDADGCAPDLRAAAALLRHSTAPLINAPQTVLASGRAANATRFSAIPGILTPPMLPLSRAALHEAEALGFPLLLRRPGFHTGRHFLRADDAEQLAEVAASIPGDDLLAVGYLNSADVHGWMRKYRVMVIDGELYPLHLAISRHWKVHYFSAEMDGQPAHQAEERAFLGDMPGVLGPAAMRALHEIQAGLGLEYAGIDFGTGADGRLHLYEANATMLIAAPEPHPQWHYRRPAYDAALAAVRRMLCRRVAALVRA